MGDFRLAVIPASSDFESADDRDLAAELARRMKGDVLFGRHDRMLYATDASIYQVTPLGVVLPRTIDDLEEIVRFARDRRLALLPRGGGTSLAGQTVNRALVIDTSKYLRRIIDVDIEAGTARVEPGVVLDQLNARLAVDGLTFGPDVATAGHATIGGMIGNNSAGARSILYGRTVENLVAVEAALADGERLLFNEGASERDARIAEITRSVAAIITPLASEIHHRFPKTRRRVDGYNLDLILDQIEQSKSGVFDRVNLAHLLCGSEGTLAVSLEATLRLVPLPAQRGLAVVAFQSVESALDALASILEIGPSAVELLDDVVIAMARLNPECRRHVELLPKPRGSGDGALFYVEFFADDTESLHERFEALDSAVGRNPIARYVDPTEMSRAWALRKAGEPLLHAIPGHRKPITFIEDTAVDPAKLAAFVRDFRAIVERHGTRAAYYAHASVGCLHIRPLIDLHDNRDRSVMESIAAEVTELVLKNQGALSGEHGDGRVRSPLLERFFGPRICAAFREIKAIFDPENRLNPGNIVAPGRMLDHLRVRPDAKEVVVPEAPTFFRYEEGFGESVEKCNGAGVCRRTAAGGTMCPSYRASLEERHSTRGRGNALRLAITGQFRPSNSGFKPNWNDPETLATLDLCLSCKACKAECPSNVDVAKLKAEYLGQGFESGGRELSLATRLIGNVRAVNRLAAVAPRLANFVNGSPMGRAVINRLFDVHPKRSLPRFERSLYRWLERRHGRTAADAPTVVLFPDCFTVYNEPHIGHAAVRVLEHLGYRVIVPTPAEGAGCCGRSSISVGMMRQASRTTSRTARALLDIINRTGAMAIVGCEPSCISAITDDWRELHLEGVARDEMNELADRASLVEQFIDHRWHDHPKHIEDGSSRPERAEAPRILLHGHCHQKALWGVESSAGLLRRVLGDDGLKVLESGCCGMAGSFGYAHHRYDLSMAIGEASLFGPVRAAPDGTIIVAPGTSCRHQIRDGTGRRAVHPIEVAAQVILGSDR